MSRQRLAWLVVLAQLAVLLAIAGQREWLRATAPTVWLRTAPVDPNDAFRGDYVALDFDIAHLDAGQRAALGADDGHRRAVWATLATDARGVATATGWSPERPAQGPLIRGETGGSRDWRTPGDVRFGIEKYFVEQGAGRAIEDRRGTRDDWQSAMEVEVALSASGTAVLKQSRWSPLALRLEVVQPATARRPGETLPADARISPRLRLSLRNDGEQPIVLLDDARHCAWQLREEQPAQQLRQRAQACDQPATDAPIRLAPGAVQAFEIDFDAPDWLLRGDDGQPQPLGRLVEGWSQYRLQYQPPVVPADRAAEAWPSPLSTPRFAGSGRVD